MSPLAKELGWSLLYSLFLFVTGACLLTMYQTRFSVGAYLLTAAFAIPSAAVARYFLVRDDMPLWFYIHLAIVWLFVINAVVATYDTFKG